MVALDFHREGGSEGRTGHLVDRLIADGHDVHLVGARIAGRWDPRVVLRPVRTPEHPHWLEVVVFCRRAAALVRAGSYDIVHNQIRPFVPGVVTAGGGSHRVYLDEVLPLESGRLRAAVKRSMPIHRFLLALERRGFHPDRCPFVIANSELNRQGILRYYPMGPERVIVAYNGVDPMRFSPAARTAKRERVRRVLGLGANDLGVIFVGQGFARKGLGPLLEAMAAIGDRQWRLAVVGRGNPSAWSARADRLGLGGRVTFVGHVPDPEAYYAAADIFALPTFFDPFANATLEAMAAGLPTVTSRRNGAAEILRHGVDGLIVDRPDDASGLAAALRSLADPERRAAMGQQARATALRYSWDGPLERTLGVYGDVTRHGQPMKNRP
jgi:UDP-glucose:(heptosyl)LPS alpha-1,3-glucosyltransferase